MKGLSDFVKGSKESLSKLTELSKSVSDSSDKGNDNEIPVDLIRPNPNQPRIIFDEKKLQSLADSISKRGVIEPIIVNRLSEDGVIVYELIAGERRWRASKIAGRKTIPAIIKNVDSQESAFIALSENIDRDDLSITEKAMFFWDIKNNFNMSSKEITEQLSGSYAASYIDELLRYAEICASDDYIKQYAIDNELTLQLWKKFASIYSQFKKAETSNKRDYKTCMKWLKEKKPDIAIEKLYKKFKGKKANKSDGDNGQIKKIGYWENDTEVGLNIHLSKGEKSVDMINNLRNEISIFTAYIDSISV